MDLDARGTRSGAPAGRLPPEIILDGRYRIKDLLGRGNMGEVYRAEDLKLEQTVALKVLPGSMAHEQERLRFLLNEVRLARQIAHPNVCRVYDVGESDGLHYLSMEFIDGEELSSWLSRGNHSLDDRVEIGRQLASGLAAAHQIGILHGDLKPANLMIDRWKQARITDFGLARWAGAPTPDDVVWGTPAYMAPEQRVGLEASVQSDLYSLGLVLYELFTGRKASTTGPVGNPKAPGELVEGLQPLIEEAILACLAMEPRDRPASAHAVMAALSGMEEGVLKTILASRLVDADTWRKSLVPEDVLRLERRHDQLVDELMDRHGGRSVESGDSLLLLFERPWNAVAFTLDYHRGLGELPEQEGCKITAQAALHLGEIFPDGVSAGRAADNGNAVSGRAEIEGTARSTVTRLCALAREGQTLLTRSAFDLARQGAAETAPENMQWLSHGSYAIDGIPDPMEIFEVGQSGVAALQPPRESKQAQRVAGQDTIPGWRPAPGLYVPGRPEWRIERRLGKGGGGEVWLAVQRASGERQCFKFCYEEANLNALKREITLFRLLKERLGERPDITRIVDWNFDDPPYFIESEYTPGGNLAEWAEEKGGLEQIPLSTRLEVVAQVADALAAAHSVGVLHKDVKPGNVLIMEGEDGHLQAQLTDFGVGLVTDWGRLEEVGITAIGMTAVANTSVWTMSGTRLYMAPEVLEGKAATLQADVYALGVVLFQMVTGDFQRALAPGWDRDVTDEILREDIARSVDGSPERRFGDAARIAKRMRSLEKRRRERQQRQQERQDAERAIAALARSRRRRRVLVAALIVVAVFAAAMFVQSQRIQAEAEVSSRVSEVLVELFTISSPDKALGNNITARQILDQGVLKMKNRELDDQPEVRARLLQTMGQVYANLALYDDAVPLLTEALSLRRDLHSGAHRDVAETLDALANLHRARGNYDDALKPANEGLAMRLEIFGGEHPTVAASLESLGHIYLQKGERPKAEQYFRDALAIRQAVGGGSPDLAKPLRGLAETAFMNADFTAAEEYYGQAIDAGRTVGDEHPDLATTILDFAAMYLAIGMAEKAEPLAREALAMRRRLFDERHPDIAIGLYITAQILTARGEYEEARDDYEEALAIYRDLKHPWAPVIRGRLGMIYIFLQEYDTAEAVLDEALRSGREQLGERHGNVAVILRHFGHLHQAKEEYAQALDYFQQALNVVGEQSEAINVDVLTADLHTEIGALFHRWGELELAEEWLQKGLDIHLDTLGQKHFHVADSLTRLAAVDLDRGELDLANSRIREATQIFRDVYPQGKWRLHVTDAVRGSHLARQGRFEEAESILQVAYQALQELRGHRSPDTQDALRRLINVYEDSGQSDNVSVYRGQLTSPESWKIDR